MGCGSNPIDVSRASPQGFCRNGPMGSLDAEMPTGLKEVLVYVSPVISLPEFMDFALFGQTSLVSGGVFILGFCFVFFWGDFFSLLASWLLGFLASWLLGFSASWLLGFLASRLLGFLASWLFGFLASWLFGFLASWLLGFSASGLLGFLASWLLGLGAFWLLGFLASWLLGFWASRLFARLCGFWWRFGFSHPLHSQFLFGRWRFSDIMGGRQPPRYVLDFLQRFN